MKRIFLFALFFAAVGAPAEVKLSAIFSDHAVLQRDKPLSVWGTATAGENVEVTFVGQRAQGKAEADGRWHVELQSLPAGGPYEMHVKGSNEIVVHDLLLGEVWLASGQSNMEFQVSGVTNATAEIESSNHPQLRMFLESARPLADPTHELQGKWEISSPATVRRFTAVGYFFALSLLNDLHVPVGIVSASVGATPAEAWTPLPLMTADPLFAANATNEITELREQGDTSHIAAALKAWEKAYDASDTGNLGFARGYAKPGATLQGWKAITLPAKGKAMGITGPAAVWMRRDITLPEGKYEQGAHVDLGPLHETNTVYFDGEKIGESGPELEPFDKHYGYTIPRSLLRAGKHTVAIRVFAHQPSYLSFSSAMMDLTLPVSDGNPVQIPLSGEWIYAIEFQKLSLSSEAMKSQPHMPEFRATQLASTLYNGEIAPLENYGLHGVIWYQGEDNADRFNLYPALMGHLIAGWRAQFGQDLPFYLAQLVNYDGGRQGWEGLREAQLKISETIPNVGLAVGLDLGETDQIHPRNKRPVGERLALLARHRVYGKKVEDSGPTLHSIKIDGSLIRIALGHADGLSAAGDSVPCFVIAGADQTFVAATARITGKAIIVSSPVVSMPVAVRYAFSQDPEGCLVYNSAKLPMGPFRSDNWPLPLPKH